MIATISAIVKGMLEASEEQLKNMTTVIDRPHVLDDEIINRSVKLYNKQNTDIAAIPNMKWLNSLSL